MLKMKNKKSVFSTAALGAVLSVSLLFSSSVSAIAPTYAKWASRTKVIYASSGSIEWAAGAAKWKNATNFNVSTGGTDKSYYAYTVNDSSVTWDGICSTTVNAGIITSATLKLNTYYTSQPKYTAAIINGVTGHEIGHSLGLEHTGIVETTSIMNPYTFDSSNVPVRALSPSSSDITATNSLYPVLQSAATNASTGHHSADGIYLSPSWAVYYEDVEALTKAADLVVKGTVSKEKGNTFKVKGEYQTYKKEVRLEVAEVLKGDISLLNSSINVSQMGGSDGVVTVYGEHTTHLNKNQEVVLFLRKTEDNTYIPINEDDSIFIINQTGEINNISTQKQLNINTLQ